MALNIHWRIPFKSLRTGTVYTVNIYDSATPTSAWPVTLKGGSQPFVTEEDTSEDEFIPIRTQTGYIRIVDDGKNANGGTLASGDTWKDMVPATDTDHPVTLTDASNNILWQGFMQAQNFSGELYGGTQEREFPIQCPLAALSSIQAPTDQTDMQNFAYLMWYIFDKMAAKMPGTPFNTYVFQGGADARKWLQKIFDWNNFLTTNDEGITSRYTLHQILEDVCRFWGWTCRTWRQQIIFTCADDINETNALVLNATTLDTLRNDITGTSSAGTVKTMYTTKMAGNIFAGTDVDDTVVRGVSKAEVKSDCNKSDDLLEFAPQSVRDTMEAGGYNWIGTDPDRSLIGYFTTPEIYSFDSQTLKGSVYSNSYGGFCRRQIYSDEKATDATIGDMIMIKHVYDNGKALVHLETKRDRIFSGGSLKMSGSIYLGDQVFQTDDRMEDRNMLMRVGIGKDYDHAQWFYLVSPLVNPAFYGWTGTRAGSEFRVRTNFSMGYLLSGVVTVLLGEYPQIPIKENMYGKVFVDFCGCDTNIGISDNFQIANFKIEYSRDSASLIGDRSRTISKARKTSQKYTATNLNKCDSKWNADCIFASDNNMEYGYGLIMNPADGSTDAGKFVYNVMYGTSPQFPEQHLASRAASFWANSRRMISAPLLSNGLCGDLAAGNISPRHKLTIDGTTCHPIAISHDWRDDITRLTLLQM